MSGAISPTQHAELIQPGEGRTLEVDRDHFDIVYSGPSGGDTVLLVAGLSMHRCEWTPELVELVHSAGYRTLMVDNRDAGLTRVRFPEQEVGLDGMARDLLRVVDALGLPRIHVVGLSMGGMIAQHMAIAAPERVASLTSLMSTTGRRGVGKPHPDCHWIFTEPVPVDDRDAYLDYAERHHRAIAPAAHVDADRARRIAGWVYDRGLNPVGTSRQLAAIRLDGDRTSRLASVTVPSLVIHGDADRLIDISGGLDTAEAIPGSRFEVLAGVGHTVSAKSAETVVSLLRSHWASAAS